MHPLAWTAAAVNSVTSHRGYANSNAVRGLDWDRNRMEGTECPSLQIRWLEALASQKGALAHSSQPDGEQLYADIGFVAHPHYCTLRFSVSRKTELAGCQVEDSQQLIFGRSLEGRRNELSSLQLLHVSCAQLRGLRAALREASG